MIANVCLYSLKDDEEYEGLEEMMRNARSLLLRVSGILTVRSGKRIGEPDGDEFMIYLEFESLDKMRICKDDPVFIKFLEDVIRPHTSSERQFVYELEPGKNIKYS